MPSQLNLKQHETYPGRQANDDLRARYRYLDLRRSALSDNLRKRSKVAHVVRNVFNEEGKRAPSISYHYFNNLVYQIFSRLRLLSC